MLKIVLEVDAPLGQADGVKESLAMDAEKYGDVRVVSVEEIRPKQMKIGEAGHEPASPVGSNPSVSLTADSSLYTREPLKSCLLCKKFERDRGAVEFDENRRIRFGVCHRGGGLAPVYDPRNGCGDWEEYR